MAVKGPSLCMAHIKSGTPGGDKDAKHPSTLQLLDWRAIVISSLDSPLSLLVIYPEEIMG